VKRGDSNQKGGWGGTHSWQVAAVGVGTHETEGQSRMVRVQCSYRVWSSQAVSTSATTGGFSLTFPWLQGMIAHTIGVHSQYTCALAIEGVQTDAPNAIAPILASRTAPYPIMTPSSMAPGRLSAAVASLSGYALDFLHPNRRSTRAMTMR
jgi:hypothetical protein